MKRLLVFIIGLGFFLSLLEFNGWAQQKAETKKAPQPSRVTRKPPTPRRTPTRRPSRTYKRKPTRYQAPVFKLQADKEAMILYFSPADFLVTEKEIFYSDIMVSNPKAKKFDNVYLVIEYDPAVLEPLGINDAKLRTNAKTAPRAVVLEGEGKIIYEVFLSQASDITADSLLLIKWKALRPTPNFTIKFSGYDNRFSWVRLGSLDVLGDPLIAEDGFVSASGVIKPLKEPVEAIIKGKEYVEKVALGRTEELGEINLLLIPRESQKVKVGEEFIVDIMLENPKEGTLDLANLVIEFDPRILGVIDFDEGNWITRDVNIYDGAYHERFPFDFHMKNNVDNQRGLITYKVGLTTLEPIPVQGCLASIKFKAIAPSDLTTVKFLPSQKGKDGTYASLMGLDMLGNPKDPADGLSNAILTVTR